MEQEAKYQQQQKKNTTKKKKKKTQNKHDKLTKVALVTYVSQSVVHQTLIASFHVFCRSSVVWEPYGTR